MSDNFEPTQQELACRQMADQAQMAQNMVPYGWGGLIGANTAMTSAEIAARHREAAVQQAVYVLEQARKIRADADLMVAIRAHIQKLRDDGAALLDDLGR